jgi:glycosyltransferase involved in cell wall biosynthesis
MMDQPIKLLVFTTLYPNSRMPGNGIFIENRIKKLISHAPVAVKVVAPVPWFPFSSKSFQKYSKFHEVPASETRHGIDIIYPRYPVIPKIGMSLSPILMALFTHNAVKKIIRDGYDFDVLDSYYFYPDGIAATFLGLILHKPVIVSALGTDLNLIPHYTLPRKMIQWAANRVAGMTTVCQALKDVLVRLGVMESRVKVVVHGVDLDLFRPPEDREALRVHFGLKRRTLLSVGYLIERKGHHIAIEALAGLPDTDLLIVGEGEEATNLRHLATRLDVDDRVRFLGRVDQSKLPSYYGAADALVLASSREGIANVLLESMACGTPVLATDIWGSPEAVTCPEAGRLLSARTADALVSAAEDLFSSYPDRSATRAYVERFSWDKTSADHLSVVRQVLAERTASEMPAL